jgi:phage minor structural protein
VVKEIKIAYFPSDSDRNTVLSSNGKVLDSYCTKATTEEDLISGNYILDATFLIDAQDYLEKEDILKVKMDYGDEVFRISKVTVGTRYIDIVARQMTIAECLTLYLEDVRPENTNGQGALSHLLTNAQGVKEIILQSDIAATNTAYYEDMNLYKALFDSDQSFITRWGGEIQRRQYTLSINSHIGIDRGVSIREGKNLTGFNGVSDIDNLVTKARGKGANNLKSNWIESPLINSYARPYQRTIEYQDVKVKGDSDDEGFATEALAKAELDRLIGLEYSKNDIDKLKATYTINFVQLSKTEEYKNYQVAETVYLGDTIRVYVPKVKCDINVRATNRKFNILSQKVEEITLSNAISYNAVSMDSIIKDIKKQLNQSNKDSISTYIDAIIKSGMKDSFLVVRENELLVMDSKDLNTAINVVRLNKSGLGFSQNGYYGTYQYGFTIDGKINASLIATGILSTVIIQNADGSFKIDLGKTGGASFFYNGKKAMEMSNNILKVFDWNKDGVNIGGLGSLNANSIPFLGLYNEKNSGMLIGYKLDDGSVYPYVQFDKYNIWGSSSDKVIRILESVSFGDDVNFATNVTANIFQASIMKASKYKSLDGNIMMLGNEFWFAPESGGTTKMYVDSTGNLILPGKITCNALDVTGTDKHRVVETSVGKVGMNAYETATCLFGDNYLGKTDANGYCTVNYDELFLETVNTSIDYGIVIQGYGPGNFYPSEIYETYCVVRGPENTKFYLEIKAKQKGSEDIRMKKIEETNIPTLTRERADEVNG